MEGQNELAASLLSSGQWLMSAAHHIVSIGIYETEEYHIEQAKVSVAIVVDRLREFNEKVTK